MSNSKETVRKILDQVKADKRTSLTAPEGKIVCDAYGIPVPKEGVAKSAADAAKLATEMGFPVVMKIVSPDILHKTEAGGVVVGVKTTADAEKAYETILAKAKKYKADAKIEGIQAHEILKGVRGSDPVNRDALADVIVKVSQLVSDFQEIVELDLNPVFATKTLSLIHI